MSFSLDLKQRAHNIGFDLVGITRAVDSPGHHHLTGWLDNGFAGEMKYMERHRAARAHPRFVLEDATSLIVLLKNYATASSRQKSEFRIARYARGRDYHKVFRKQLKNVAELIHDHAPDCQTRIAVDSAPLMERDFSVLAGLGWIGKNTMLINKHIGSWTLAGAILTTLELEYDDVHESSHCGTCTRCLEACPTDAFVGPFQLDSRRCISYQTIELKESIPTSDRTGIDDWLFGCDICQDVCPWNRKAPQETDDFFGPRPAIEKMTLSEILSCKDDILTKAIAGSPLSRPGIRGIRRNAMIVAANRRQLDTVPILMEWCNSEDSVLREAAAWALDRINRKLTNPNTRIPEKK